MNLAVLIHPFDEISKNWIKKYYFMLRVYYVRIGNSE